LSAETEKPTTEDEDLKIEDLRVIARRPKRPIIEILPEMREDIRLRIEGL
jgi:hypothetical protein